jgi:phosphoesterase RecJ-like protein
MQQQFKQLISESERIIVTSHISPDPDAISSLLLMGLSLKQNYPGKNIKMVLEEGSDDLSVLGGYDQIEITPLDEALENQEPDLFILLDGNNFERCSRHNGQAVRDFINNNHIKTIVIDHHELSGSDDVDLFINREYPATVQEIYQLLFKELDMNKPEGIAQTVMAGLYADTGGFVYMKAGRHSELFSLIDELVGQGANIETVRSLLSRYSEADLQALSELAANIAHKDDFSYSFIPDEFISKWLQDGHTQGELQRATGTFLDSFIRNIDGRQWGFIVYKNTLQGEDVYSVSFRSMGDVKDVSAIASKLGGGGHKPAAGAKIQSSSVDEAIAKVMEAVEKP